ncbi:MAG TPA: adenylyl-sulfate kinase [Cellvibrio sp.]
MSTLDKLLNCPPCVFWFTGLSGSGKSTTALALQAALQANHCKTYLLDGDILRTGLCKDLGFTMADRHENIRRVGEVAKLMVDAGIVVITATISPLRKMRDDIRARFSPAEFIEIFIDTPLEICEQRDPKGLYRKARAGKIAEFTGIDSAYEAPIAPELHLYTLTQTPEENAQEILRYLHQTGYFLPGKFTK